LLGLLYVFDSQPFPLNPSFKPPIPVSDELRTSIYRQFMANPEQNSVRVLAGKYYLSMKRVDAILRLKGLEEHWKQVRAHFIPVDYVSWFIADHIPAEKAFTNRVPRRNGMVPWCKTSCPDSKDQAVG
jgi:hypothetical protein